MTALTPRAGRRVIMLLTDGIDTASRATAESLFTRTRADDLMIYVVQFRTTARASLAEAPLAPSASELFSNRGTLNPRESMAAVRSLARQTGGGYFALNEYDDVNTTFTHVMRELHYQYVLGFTPRRADGRVHDLQVRVNRPWLSVRARQTYLAPRPGRVPGP
jgi:VWFA-related protein